MTDRAPNLHDLDDAWQFRLKAATRDLVTLCGGLGRASRVCGRAVSTIQRWYDPDTADTIPLPAVVLLERAGGRPVVTDVLAALSGHVLADPNGDPAEPPAGVVSAFAALAAEEATLSSLFAAAQADGRLTPAEITRLDREAAEVAEALAQFRDGLAGRRAAVRKSQGRRG